METGGIRGLFEAGGIVMYPLLICSILAVALAIERTIFWLKIYKRQRRVAMDVLNLYESNNIVSVLEKLKKNIATSFGLIVGIMTITLASIFRGLYQREIGRIEEYGGYLELFHRRHQQSKQKYEFTERS